jgi:DNA-binding transcriptional LysR family regulator
MDRFETMRAFVRVVERRSFTQAAEDLVLPRSRVSEAIQQLERRLGVSLLVRTTRKVTPTAEGEDFYRRAIPIMSALEEAEAAVTEQIPSGPLRIDVHGTFARRFLLPGLPEFLARHPGIRLHIGEGDRLVDLIGEGVDCVIRVGDPADSGLVGRKLGMIEEGTFASPAYLARHGTPNTLEDLAGHCAVGFLSSALRTVFPLEFRTDAGLRTISLPPAVTVSSAGTNAHLARLGLGLIQVPRYRVAQDLETGALVEVLAAYPPTPTPVFLLYPEGRQLSPRVRLFIDWAALEISRQL